MMNQRTGRRLWTTGQFEKVLSRRARARYVPWVVLGVMLTVTFQLWKGAERSAIGVRKSEFDFRARDVTEQIKQRMSHYEQVLYGARAFFVNQHRVEHKEFTGYIAALRLQEKFPGIQGISYIPLVRQTQKKAHERLVRKDGVAGYAIRPSGMRESYAPVAYIEPLNKGNRRVLGYDNFSSPPRKAALEQAADLNQAVVSEKLELIQDSDRSKAGFLMILPVYKHGAPTATVAERRANISGWLAAFFHTRDLMTGVLGQEAGNLDVEIYDGGEMSAPGLMYDSDNDGGVQGTRLFKSFGRVEINGRQWGLDIHSIPAFEAGVDRSKPYFIAVAGILMSLMLSAITALLVRDRTRAIETAAGASTELRERRKVQQALADNEQRWKLALEGAGHGVWDWNPQTDEVLCSELAKQMRGYSADDFPYRFFKDWWAGVHPDDQQQVEDAIRQHLAGTMPNFIFEYRALCKNGEWKWFITRGMVVERDQQGKPLRMLGTHTDISERRSMGDALRQSEEKYRALVESALSIILRWDTQGRIVYINRYAEELFGYQPDELIGRHVVGTIVPETESTSRDLTGLMDDILARPEKYQLNINENMKKSGERIWVMWTNCSLFDKAGNLVEVLSVGYDITGRMRTEEALRESEEKYRELFEFANEFIVTTDLENNVTSANHLVVDTLGYSLEELLGMNIGGLMTPASHELEKQMTAKKLGGESKVTRYEVELRARDGRPIQAEFSTRLIYKDGKPVGIHAIGHDISERLRYEHALRESEERYRNIFANAQDFIFTLDTASRFTSVTHFFCQATGYDEEEVIGAHIGKFMSPDNLAKAQRMTAMKVSGDAAITRYELELLTKDGRSIPIEINSTLMYRNGNLMGVQGIGRDISERRSYEKALRQSEEKYREFFEFANDFAYSTDNEGYFTAANNSLLEATGYMRKELIGAHFGKIVAPESQALAQRMTALKMSGKELITRYELEIVAADGRRIPIELVSTLIYKDGKPVGEQGIGRDITELLAREEALQRSERNYRELMEQAADAISIYDENLSCVDVNRATEEMFGFSRDEFLTLGLRDLVHPDDLVRLAQPDEMAKLKLMMEGKITIHGERRMRRKDGSYIPVEVSAKRLSDGRILSIKRDISDWLEREKALREMNAKAEAAGRAKSEFLANMSHEIRTPMNSVIGMARLALLHETDPAQRGYLEKILLSGEHLLGIIDDILDFSKIDAGKLRIEEVDLDLVKVMESVSGLVAEKARVKGLRFEVSVANGIPRHLRGDPLRLRQVLLNFADNAIKFTDRGEVMVGVRKLDDDAEGCHLLFEVHDTGIGVSGDQLAGLFRSFQQADGSVTRKYGGTGLGLVISKQLVEMMGGEIGVESEPGRGSTFWFRVRLPHGAANAREAAADPAGARDAIRGKHMLLVENNLFNQQVAREFLENAGAVVVVANNGAEALDLLRYEHFDGVLMDLQMPVMDGFEATQHIRANPQLAAMPVIAMTANALEEERRRCLAAGMDDFISKPVRPEVLYAVLSKWLLPAAGRADGGNKLMRGDMDRGETGAEQEASLIDLAALDELVGGRRDKVREFVYKFLVTTKADMDRIDDALARQDMAQLKELGHHVKSPAAMVGAAKFSELCRALETSEDGLEQARALVLQMHVQLDKIDAQVRKQFP